MDNSCSVLGIMRMNIVMIENELKVHGVRKMFERCVDESL